MRDQFDTRCVKVYADSYFNSWHCHVGGNDRSNSVVDSVANGFAKGFVESREGGW